MASRPKRSPSSKARPPAPLPRPKRTDPPGLPLPTDPRTWSAWRRRLHAHRWYAVPRPALDDHSVSAVWNAADCVLNEVAGTLGLRRFPKARWRDWLCRRAECYARLSRRLRPRLTGEQDREWLRVYMRNWIYSALRRTAPHLGACLPPEMWCGHSPLDHGVPLFQRWRVPGLGPARLGDAKGTFAR